MLSHSPFFDHTLLVVILHKKQVKSGGKNVILYQQHKPF